MSGKKGAMWKKWTDEELVILREGWPKGGYRYVRDLLPERTVDAIKGAADRLGILIPGRTYQKHEPSEWVDAAIVRAYRTATSRGCLKPLAKSLNRPQGWIRWRAQMLGVARPGVYAIGAPKSAWTAEEDRLLAQCIDNGMKPSGISALFRRQGYRRSISAIITRAKIKELPFDREDWNANDVGKALGVDAGSVLNWINRGWLKAQKTKGPTTEDRDTKSTMWEIKVFDLRKFMLLYPQAWDHRRMNKEIMLEILCGTGKPGIGAFATDKSA